MTSKKNLSYQQLKKNRWFLLVLTLGLVILIVAIFIELVHSQTKSQVDPKLKKYAIALSPTFNESVFNKLDTLTYLSPQEVREEVANLPVRIIDRETKQIMTLQRDGTVAASQSARLQEQTNQTATDSGIMREEPNETFDTETLNQENEETPTP